MIDEKLSGVQVKEVITSNWYMDTSNLGSLFVPLNNSYQCEDVSVESALIDSDRKGIIEPEEKISYVRRFTGVTLELVPDSLKRYDHETGFFYTI